MYSVHQPWKSLELGRKLKWISFFLIGIFTLIIFIWNVKHYYFHGDDCYISFRYALNLYKGHGLVWNLGERVEGYTNFLWVLLMAFGMVLKIPPEIFSNLIGIASGVVLLTLLVYFSAIHAGWDNPIIWLTPLVLSTSRTFTGWCTGGLATMFFTMLLFSAFLMFVKERKKGVEYPIGSSLLFAVATLTRPDGLLFIFIAGIFFTTEVLLKKRKFISLLIWAASLILIVGIHFLWRYSYYGFWLPNTFYAKVSGFWGERAYYYLSLFQQYYKISFFFPLILIPIIVGRKFVYALFLGVIIAYLAYIIYIGGDRHEFRFLVYIFPYFYWLLIEGIRLLTSLKFKKQWLQYGTIMAAVAMGSSLLVTTHFGSSHTESRKGRYVVVSIQSIKKYTERRVKEGKFLRSLIDKGALPDDIILGVWGAGAVPYYTCCPTVDLLGMNDINIAHKHIKHRKIFGHEKRASLGYMRKRKIEFVDVKNKILHNRPDINQKCKTNEGCLKSIRVGKYYLNFKTFLPDKEFERRFEKLLKDK